MPERPATHHQKPKAGELGSKENPIPGYDHETIDRRKSRGEIFKIAFLPLIDRLPTEVSTTQRTEVAKNLRSIFQGDPVTGSRKNIPLPSRDILLIAPTLFAQDADHLAKKAFHEILEEKLSLERKQAARDGFAALGKVIDALENTPDTEQNNHTVLIASLRTTQDLFLNPPPPEKTIPPLNAAIAALASEGQRVALAFMRDPQNQSLGSTCARFNGSLNRLDALREHILREKPEKAQEKPNLKTKKEPTSEKAEQSAETTEEIAEKKLLARLILEGASIFHISSKTESQQSTDRNGTGFESTRDERAKNIPTTERRMLDAQLTSNLKDQLQDREFFKKNRLKEIIAIRPATKTGYTETIQEKEIGSWPFKKMVREVIKTPIQIPLTTRDIGLSDAEEQLIKFEYRAGDLDDDRTYQDYSRRYGQELRCSLFITQKTANEIEQTIRKDPTFARRIVEEFALKNQGFTREGWKGSETEIPLRPPYQKWDEANSGMLIIKPEDLKRNGYGKITIPEHAIVKIPLKK